MDRPIEDSVIQNRRRRRGAVGALLVALILVAVFLLPAWIKPSVERDRIRTAVVELGLMEETITASGLVLPEHEHVITSPSPSRVQEILRRPGDAIEPGTPIVKLDMGEARLSVERLERQIALKENEQLQARIELESKLADLSGQEAIKRLELKSFEFERERNRKLFEEGLIVEDAYRKSETDVDRATIELEQLAISRKNERRALNAQLSQLDLEMQILQKEREGAEVTLEQGTATSQLAGVLTWVVSSEGTAVSRGDEVARVADLSSFKVEATLSDVHAERIRVAQPVTARSGDHRLRGHIAKVLPTVENGIVRLEVTLDEPSNPLLRHNLRVDVHIVVDRREETVRIKRGTFANVEGQQVAFVIHGDIAVRTPIKLGLTNFEMYEVVEGLAAGDEVILSDMSDHRTSKEVRIR